MSTAPGGAAIGATLLYCEKFALPAVVSPDTSSAVSLHVLFGVPPGLAGPVCVVRSGSGAPVVAIHSRPGELPGTSPASARMTAAWPLMWPTPTLVTVPRWAAIRHGPTVAGSVAEASVPRLGPVPAGNDTQ